MPRSQHSCLSDSCSFVFNPILVIKYDYVVGSMIRAMLQKTLSYLEKVQSDGEGIMSTHIHTFRQLNITQLKSYRICPSKDEW